MFISLFFSINAFAKCIEGDCINGNGTWLFEDGDKYIGEHKNGKANGEGTYLIGSYGHTSAPYNGAYAGWDNAKTSDLLKPDGTVVPGFNTSTYIQYAL